MHELHVRGSFMCLVHFFWYVIHGCLFTQALADVRSTCAVIKGLCCRVHWDTLISAQRGTSVHLYNELVDWMHCYRQDKQRNNCVIRRHSMVRVTIVVYTEWMNIIHTCRTSLSIHTSMVNYCTWSSHSWPDLTPAQLLLAVFRQLWNSP